MPLAATNGSERPSTALDTRGPLLAVAVVFAFLIASLFCGPAEGSVSGLPWTVDPIGIASTRTYLCLYLLTIPAKHVMDAMLGFLATRVLGFGRMDVGETKIKKLEVLEGVDLSYLALNTMVEFVGMNHVVAFLVGEHVLMPLGDITILNGPVAFLVLMLLNDVIYYPFHLVAHVPWLYPYCHKQHHRQFFPFRGYADAANQHPIEQTYGFSIFIFSLLLTSCSTGLHAGTAGCAFFSWAFFNVANHLAFDSSVHLPLPYPAFPRDHSMHHRLNRCNYSTLTSCMDRAFGTFRRYQALNGTKQESSECTATVCPRPEAVPSPWSVVGLATGISVVGLLVETGRTGAAPPLAGMMALLPVWAVLFLAAVGCAASGLVSSVA
eukprot:TRINITY_DN23926_c0_g3_i1.p1 TRINITY_DN23926_c0_g3~~TRINITY_DN23926_c0_g3_i1.p1  ORF type:complete len:396 (+),score=34.74 TRINITY_DN23926_c0_g3_i1:49-1188(+)